LATKLTYEYVKNYIEENGDGDKLVSEEYINAKEKLIFKCHICGKNFEMEWANYHSGRRHRECSLNKSYEKRRLDYDYVHQVIEEWGYTLLDDTYMGNKAYMNICDKTGYKYYIPFGDFGKGIKHNNVSFAKFGKGNPYTIDNIQLYLKNSASDFYLCDGQVWDTGKTKMVFIDALGYKYSLKFHILKNEIDMGSKPRKYDVGNIYTLYNMNLWIEKHNFSFKLIDNQEYKGAFGKLKFKCSKNCPYGRGEFETRFSCIEKGRDCSTCCSTYIDEYNNLATISDVAIEWDYERNYPVVPDDVFAHTLRKYWWKCQDCGHSYFSSVAGRTKLNDSRGCPYCNESSLEKKIRKVLTKNNILFEKQKRFNDCRDKNTLPFDFYLSEYNILCEAQGRQHLIGIDFFGGEEQLILQQRHDQIKRDYCKNNNIKLIEISYLDFKNIEKILITELNL
jgi:hypothetical protein